MNELTDAEEITHRRNRATNRLIRIELPVGIRYMRLMLIPCALRTHDAPTKQHNLIIKRCAVQLTVNQSPMLCTLSTFNLLSFASTAGHRSLPKIAICTIYLYELHACARCMQCKCTFIMLLCLM